MAARSGHERGALVLGHRGDLDDDLVDPGKRPDLANDITLDLVAHGARGDGERDLDGHGGAVEEHVLHHAQLDDVGAELGIDDAPERGFDGGAVRHARIVGRDEPLALSR